MPKKAYVIASDLHLQYRNKQNRHRYLDECDCILSTIERIGQKYLNDGYIPYLFLLGDVADNSFKGTDKPVIFNNKFVSLRNTFVEIDSVIGNHETTYYKDNPFWSLFSEMESERMQKVLTKTWIPRGILQIINVKDTLTDGEVVFHFNHYDAEMSIPIDGKINIGLFHKNIVPKEIGDLMKKTYGLDIWDKEFGSFGKTNILSGYNYCFLGHNHKVYGKFKWTSDFDSNQTMWLYYLASLLRPNHSEVSNTFLERNIPAVLVNDGKFVGIENNLITLLSREESVKESVVKIEQENRKRTKERRTDFSNMVKTDDPIKNVEGTLANRPAALVLFRSILNREDAQTELELERKVLNLNGLYR